MTPRLLAVCCLLLAGAAPAPEGVPEAHTRSPVFRIPFRPDGNEKRWRQVELYVSTNQGRSWDLKANARPDDGHFVYTAKDDGTYWFSTRTVDLEGRGYPPSMDNAVPQLKVIVDTQPPVIRVTGLPPRDGQAQVEWDIRDDHLDPNSLEMDYRVQGSNEWQPLRIDPRASGRQAWRPTAGPHLEVRLRARDKAGNEAEQRAPVIGPQDGRFGDSGRFTANPEPVRGGDRLPDPNAPTRLVNSTTFDLNYKVKEAGKSGISRIELWTTKDGRGWQKYDEKTFNHESPAGPATYPVKVHGEGLYGFTLVVLSGVGLGGQAPQVNEPPQVWVEVDLTKPQVRLEEVYVGRGSEAGRLAISWRASDKNLAPRPITLSYAEKPTGAWKIIANELDNSGRHIWDMPGDLPFEFYIKVEAADRAGNVGSDQSQTSVKVDLAVPKTEILDVAPGRK